MIRQMPTVVILAKQWRGLPKSDIIAKMAIAINDMDPLEFTDFCAMIIKAQKDNS